jgi:hypothetical protein
MPRYLTYSAGLVGFFLVCWLVLFVLLWGVLNALAG